jgi:hypothetical protein
MEIVAFYLQRQRILSFNTSVLALCPTKIPIYKVPSSFPSGKVAGT